MKLNNEQKAILVQCCINCYIADNGKGIHGDVDYSFIEGGKDGMHRFDENNSEGWTGIINMPGVGRSGIVVYEGSSGDKDSGLDWKKNFDTKLVDAARKAAESNSEMQVPYGNTNTKIRMHKGFSETYMETREMTRDFAKWCWKQGLPYFVTGHSLGGAITTLDFIDKQYMFATEMGIPEENLGWITGYAAASPAVFNWEGKESFNRRARGNFYNEWFGGDTVHKVPTWYMGYWHVGIEKRYADIWANLYYPLDFIPALRLLPVWDHDPRRLLAAIQGRPIPPPVLDTSK